MNKDLQILHQACCESLAAVSESALLLRHWMTMLQSYHGAVQLYPRLPRVWACRLRTSGEILPVWFVWRSGCGEFGELYCRCRKNSLGYTRNTDLDIPALHACGLRAIGLWAQSIFQAFDVLNKKKQKLFYLHAKQLCIFVCSAFHLHHNHDLDDLHRDFVMPNTHRRRRRRRDSTVE